MKPTEDTPDHFRHPPIGTLADARAAVVGFFADLDSDQFPQNKPTTETGSSPSATASNTKPNTK